MQNEPDINQYFNFYFNFFLSFIILLLPLNVFKAQSIQTRF